MINQLQIKNLQSHKDTTLDFSPNVNVIMGTSNSGKSAVIRALRWCLLNKPGGFGFRRHNTEGKELTSVKITCNGHTVIRQRNTKTTNEYVIDNDTKLEALRGAVPEEVTTTTNITELNIQSQFDPYFLLADTAGEVARTINSYTGMQIIDAVLKVAQGRLMTATNAVNTLTTQVEEQQSIVESQSDITTAQAAADRLTLASAEYEELNCQATALSLSINGLKKAREVIQAKTTITQWKEEVVFVRKKLKAHLNMQERHNDLSNCLKEINNTLKQCEKHKVLVAFSPPVNLIADKLDELADKQDTYDALKDTLHILQTNTAAYFRAEDIVKQKDAVLTIQEKLKEQKEKIIQRRIGLQLVRAISSNSNALIGAQQYITSLQEKLKGVSICPLCKQPTDEVWK